MRYISRAVLALFFVVLFAVPTRANPVSSGYRNVLDEVSELILVHHYHGAEVLLDSLQRAHPDSTDIRFQRMVLYFTWIDDYGIADSLGRQLTDCIDSIIRFADRDARQNPNDKWAWFFEGSAYAYRSLYRSYVDGITLRTIPSLLSDASTGIDDLKRAAQTDTSFTDPLLGIGKYLHWKSKKFPWPLATARDGELGIRYLEEAVAKGVSVDGSAEQTLGWVYMAEHRYDEAIALVQPLMAKYPDSRFFSEIVARAYQEKGENARAEAMFKAILDGLSAQERASNFIVMKYARWIARLRLQEGYPDEACQMAQRLRRLDYRGVHPDWLRRKLGEVDNVIREACVQ